MTTAQKTPKVSVVLCAHNPRRDLLDATLESLRRQDLSLDQWELILVDNNSNPPLDEWVNLDWHTYARHVFEPEPGLANARCCGYRQSRGGIVVNSDDDNILQKDYLSKALAISIAYPLVGTYGGQLVPEFEVQPVNQQERDFGGARVINGDRWSNVFDDNRTMPFGAGMCIRREVVDEYVRQITADPRRLGLGRSGSRLLAGEDIDVNWVAASMGLATGLFERLSLKHYIPAQKMTAGHLIRYAEGNAYSMVVLHWLHFGEIKIPRHSKIGALVYWLRIWLRMDSFARRMQLAQIKGRREAVEDMRKWRWLD